MTALAPSNAKARQALRTKLLAIANPRKPESKRQPADQIELQLDLEDVQRDLETIAGPAAKGIEAEDVGPQESMLVTARRGAGQALTLGRNATKNVRRLVAEAPSRKPRLRSSKRLIRESDTRDRLLSGLLILGAVTAYAVSQYSPSWGSLTDYLTALLAGFGSQTIVKWALLPIFQTISPRFRSAKGSAAGDTADVAPSGA
jgi:hypothetical protein